MFFSGLTIERNWFRPVNISAKYRPAGRNKLFTEFATCGFCGHVLDTANQRIRTGKAVTGRNKARLLIWTHNLYEQTKNQRSHRAATLLHGRLQTSVIADFIYQPLSSKEPWPVCRVSRAWQTRDTMEVRSTRFSFFGSGTPWETAACSRIPQSLEDAAPVSVKKEAQMNAVCIYIISGKSQGIQSGKNPNPILAERIARTVRSKILAVLSPRQNQAYCHFWPPR